MDCVSCWMHVWNEVINELISFVLIGGCAMVSRFHCGLSGMVSSSDDSWGEGSSFVRGGSCSFLSLFCDCERVLGVLMVVVWLCGVDGELFYGWIG